MQPRRRSSFFLMLFLVAVVGGGVGFLMMNDVTPTPQPLEKQLPPERFLGNS